MDYNNRRDLAGFRNNGNSKLDSKISLVDFFIDAFKTIFFLVPLTRKVFGFMTGLFVGRRK